MIFPILCACIFDADGFLDNERYAGKSSGTATRVSAQGTWLLLVGKFSRSSTLARALESMMPRMGTIVLRWDARQVACRLKQQVASNRLSGCVR